MLKEASKVLAPNLSQAVTSVVKSSKILKVIDATKSDHRHEISEDVLVPSKKREVREGENCHTDAPLPLELPKSRKTAPASLDVNLQSEVAAGCSAYHLHVQAERSSRTAGCSAYPTNPPDLVEKSSEEVKENCKAELQPQGRYGVISLFDGVSSVVPST